MIYQYNKPSELLARQKQTGESYWDMIGEPLPKYTDGKNNNILWYKPSNTIRKFIRIKEGSDFVKQNKKFGGDAIGVKASELNRVLLSHGISPEMINQGMYDALLSYYYNVKPSTFNNKVGRYLKLYSTDLDEMHYNWITDSIRDRYKYVDKMYRNSILNRAAMEASFVPSYKDWKGIQVVNTPEQDLQYTAPTDATTVAKPEVVPLKIPADTTTQPVSYEPNQEYKTMLPDIMQAYLAILSGKMPLLNLNLGEYGYDDYTEA